MKVGLFLQELYEISFANVVLIEERREKDIENYLVS